MHQLFKYRITVSPPPPGVHRTFYTPTQVRSTVRIR